MLDVEVNHLGKIFPGRYSSLKAYMDKSGYELAEENFIDAFFVKKKMSKVA